MKYCADYFSECKKLKEVDEINVIFSPKNTDILGFIEKYQPKRVNLCINNIKQEDIENQIKLAKAFIEKYPDTKFHLRIPFSKEETNKIVEIIKENNVPFYFSDFATTWDTLIGFLLFGVSDIFVAEDLGFELDNVSEIIHAANAKVRVYPNIAQSSYPFCFDIDKFFIRPEDVKIYERYVDIFEFYGNIKKFDTLYEIYNQGYWNGPLREIILNFYLPVDNREIVGLFGEIRAKCGKRCLKGKPCAICHRILDLAETLKENSLIITH